MPATWKAYGTDANKDGLKDPYNPVDAIFAAARYLRAAGAETDLRRAIFAYNHADWYVDSVMLRARVLGGLPSNFVGSLTGLTQGHFPVAARATYADDISEAEVADRRRPRTGNAAWAVESAAQRRSINIYAKRNAPVIAVNDGRIVKVGENARLGRFVELQDVFGNTYTYSHLGSVAKLYPAAKAKRTSQAEIARELKLPKADAAPAKPATAGTTVADALKRVVAGTSAPKPQVKVEPVQKERLFAHPLRRRATEAGGAQQILQGKAPKGSFEIFRRSVTTIFGVHTKSNDVTLKPLKPGATVIAGTILGRVDKPRNGLAPHLEFSIRPAGRGAPRIDPKPILDGWKLLETTAIYRAAGQNPFSSGNAPSIGQILLMDKESLQRLVLADPRIEIYSCGRRDIRLGQIDRRVLATLEYLSLSGFKPTVTSLNCGHSYLTASGNVSHHSSGNAVDIAKINGIPILGHQGSGSITDIVVRRLITLQGLMRPRADHLADEVRRGRQHGGDGRPCRPHPRRLPAAVRHRSQAGAPDQRHPQAQAVDQAGRPPQRDRRPGGQAGPVEVRARGRGQGRLTDSKLYRFVQFEYAWPLGPDDGRYLLREHAGEDPHHVLVFASWPTVAQRRSRRWGREPEPQSLPAETGLSRATLVQTTTVDDEAAHAWLESLVDAAADEAVTEGIQVLNEAIRAFRAVSADPFVREVTAEQALTIRVGYGIGVEVADGAWTAARDVPTGSDKGSRGRRKRLAALRPQERFAAVLGGRDAVLACEELTLRARADLEHQRPREAALQTHLALEAAIAELAAFRGQESVGRRLGELSELRDAVAAAANEALQHGPSAETVATVRDALEKVETILRARSASAVY